MSDAHGRDKKFIEADGKRPHERCSSLCWDMLKWFLRGCDGVDWMGGSSGGLFGTL
jgi:hypothetical protein